MRTGSMKEGMGTIANTFSERAIGVLEMHRVFSVREVSTVKEAFGLETVYNDLGQTRGRSKGLLVRVQVKSQAPGVDAQSRAAPDITEEIRSGRAMKILQSVHGLKPLEDGPKFGHDKFMDVQGDCFGDGDRKRDRDDVRLAESGRRGVPECRVQVFIRMRRSAR